MDNQTIFKCGQCGRICKNATGLLNHRRACIDKARERKNIPVRYVPLSGVTPQRNIGFRSLFNQTYR